MAPPPSAALVLLLLLLAAPLPPTAAAKGRHAFTTATSSYRRISWARNLTLLGSACLLPGAASVALTSNASDGIGAGRAIFSVLFSFRLPPPDRTAAPAQASFRTRFTFRIAPSPSYGDGLAFILTSSRTFLGASNGYLGLYPSGPASDAGDLADVSTVAVEFDTHRNVELRDPDSNHVALDAGSIFSVASASPGVDLRAGVPITAWVVYRATPPRLRAWVSSSPSRRPRKAALSVDIDLSPFLRAKMYAGFSASNSGEGTAVHVVDVNTWSFRIVDPPKSMDLPSSPPVAPESANDDTGSPPPAQELAKGQHSYLGMKITLGILVCIVVIGTVAWLFWLFWLWRNKPKKYKTKIQELAVRRMLPAEVERSV